jgi:two-component system sensor histidine kinase and response regulator WspE
MSSPDLSQMSMLELFRQEAESQTHVLSIGLLELEQNPSSADQLEACMRAAHSLKGAARIIGLAAGVDVAHVMEDCFVLAQRGELTLHRKQIDALLQGVDLLTRIAHPPGNDETWGDHAGKPEITAFIARLTKAMAEPEDDGHPTDRIHAAEPAAAEAENSPANNGGALSDSREGGVRSVRVNARNLDRLLSLSGESLVESRRLKPFTASILRLKRTQREAGQALDLLHQQLSTQTTNEATQAALSEVRTLMMQCQHMVADQLGELETFDRRSVNLSQRLYDEALACRMRPFADGTHGYARMVRDVGHALGKSVRLEITGNATQIDRDILEKLEAPIGHLLRNAIDHGIESPQQRKATGKPEQGTITLEARHSAGMLLVNVSDDGAGIDLDQLRAAIIQRKLSNADTVAQLSEAELLEFLLLPSFSLRDTVTDISGRGVGLDGTRHHAYLQFFATGYALPVATTAHAFSYPQPAGHHQR